MYQDVFVLENIVVSFKSLVLTPSESIKNGRVSIPRYISKYDKPTDLNNEHRQLWILHIVILLMAKILL